VIHVFVGTKAQFIKMAPVMLELDRREIPYNFIDAGQHASVTQDLVGEFSLRAPDVRLRNDRTSITTFPQAILWTFSTLARALFRSREVFRTIFRGTGGVCLIHGDTLTTLISLVHAKRCGLMVAHVEAGLRSHSLFNPFPEELIRLIAMRYSDTLFAPTPEAYDNLRAMGLEAKSILVRGNTIADAVRFVREHSDQGERPTKPYAVITCHRVETLYSRARLAFLVELVARVSEQWRVLFVLHEPTRQHLARSGLLTALESSPNVDLLPLQPYGRFITLLDGAEFVVTDGGSIQEEAHLLGLPCLLIRTKTERPDGIGQNAHMAQFRLDEVDHFFQRLPDMRRSVGGQTVKPSEEIVDRLLGFA
jgi:UDP-N-acetylglucosamine 2-epimerase (non-hydrolysing)